jgi:hypothetical protein
MFEPQKAMRHCMRSLDGGKDANAMSMSCHPFSADTAEGFPLTCDQHYEGIALHAYAYESHLLTDLAEYLVPELFRSQQHVV